MRYFTSAFINANDKVLKSINLTALEKAGIPHKTLWLEGADHFYSTLFYHHNVKFYTELLAFLDNDCFQDDGGIASR